MTNDYDRLFTVFLKCNKLNWNESFVKKEIKILPKKTVELSKSTEVGKKKLKINNTDKKVEIKNNRPTIPLQSALCIEIGGFI